MLRRHLEGERRYVRHPITNGVAEGLNSKIMSIKRKAGGFRNAQHFTTAIYFHCGGSTATHADRRRGKIRRARHVFQLPAVWGIPNGS